MSPSFPHRCSSGLGVGGNVGVVEATVLVFLDDARLGHGAKALTDASLQHGAVQHGLQGGCARPPRWPSGSRSPDKRSASGGFAVVADPGCGLRPYTGYVASSPAPAPHHPRYFPPFAAPLAPLHPLAPTGMTQPTPSEIPS